MTTSLNAITAANVSDWMRNQPTTTPSHLLHYERREVRAIVASTTSELLGLAQEADQHFSSSSTMVGNLTETDVSPTTETLPKIHAVFNNRRLNNRPPNAGRTIHQEIKHRPSDQQTDSDLCFYHRKFRRRSAETHSTSHEKKGYPQKIHRQCYRFAFNHQRNFEKMIQHHL